MSILQSIKKLQERIDEGVFKIYLGLDFVVG